MLKIQVSNPSSDPPITSLADLSRNASVISSSSSSSSTSSLVLKTPRPRPIRTFSSPRSRSPASPTTPRASKPPAYLAKELGITDDDAERQLSKDVRVNSRAPTRPPSRVRGSRNNSASGRLSAQDFQFGDILGEGSYSTVKLGTYRTTGQEYAIKMLDKGHLQRHHKLQTALAEKNTLVRLGAGHPGIVRLHWAFHDEWCLYFVLDLARNGEMQTRISRMGSLSLPCARYYAAQIVDALDYMHSKGVIHRDLKPENLLLDDDFRIKITDFGTGKLLDSGDQRANSFVGTAQYVSPELLESSETSKSSDLWALACIVYQMIAGRFTFQGLSDYLTWQKIKRLEYSFPEGFDEQAKDLVQKILVRDPTQRLGAGPPGTANDMQALRSHPFFGSINWKTLWKDPAPKLEPGLIKKPPPPPGSVQHSPWDVDASWDNIVNGDGHRDEDEISWASDGDATEYQHSQSSHSHGVPNGNGYAYQHEDVGPMNEVRWPAAHVVDVPERQGDGDADTDGLGPHEALRERENEWERQRSLFGGRPLSSLPEPISVPSSDLAARDSYSTGSTTSSSDGSPIEKLSAALEAMMFDRGRNRAQTPIQGNGPAGEVDWSAILLPGESILFNSSVQPGSLRRRASRLLSMAVTPKVKTRQLVLTTHRLVCLKQLKGNRGLGVKSEFILRVPDEEGKKDTRSVVVSVEPKGEREFVVLTNHKSHSYIADTPSITSLWMEKIREAVKPTSPARETQASASRT